MPAKIEQIMEIAKRYEIPVIEDAAEAMGSRYKNKALGTFGMMGVLSFNGNKIITTSSGGALISDDEDLMEKSRFLAQQARDNAPHYQQTQIGYNYRMSNVVAGIGRGQMEVLDKHMALRRRNFELYKTQLSGIEGISLPEEPDGDYFSNYWLSYIQVDPAKTNGITPETIRLAMEASNIDSRPLWKPMHQQPVFASAPFYGNGTSEKLFDQGLCLPSGSNLTESDFERIFSVFDRVF